MAPRNACVGTGLCRRRPDGVPKHRADGAPDTGCRLRFPGYLDRLKERQNLNGLDFAAFCAIANGCERL
jgi:hypothetical protein